MFGNVGSFSLVRLLGTISRGIGIAREIMPIYKEVKPMINNIPKFFNDMQTKKNLFQNSIKQNIDYINNNNNINKNYIGPKFFQ